MNRSSRRLFLRQLTHADLDFVASMLAHPEVMEYWGRTFCRDEAREWIDRQIARYAADGCGYWLASLRDTDLPIGQAGIMMVDLGDQREAALGYIMHRPFWRQGYALEASLRCVEYARDELGRDRVVAMIRPENKPSVQLAQKLGMTIERTIMYHDFVHDVWVLE